MDHLPKRRDLGSVELASQLGSNQSRDLAVVHHAILPPAEMDWLSGCVGSRISILGVRRLQVTPCMSLAAVILSLLNHI
jgi:hypothetical protein